MLFRKEIEEHEQRKNKVLAMGGEEKLRKRKESGMLNARERIDYLLDLDSFLETGMYATSLNPEDREQTPADGKIAGFGSIDGRKIGIISNDFTVKGASSSPVNSKKLEHLKGTSRKKGFPLIFLGESTGGRMPDVMGAKGIIGGGGNPIQYMRKRETPWVSAAL